MDSQEVPKFRWPWQVEYRTAIREKNADLVICVEGHLLGRLVDLTGVHAYRDERSALRKALGNLRVLQRKMGKGSI